MYNTASAWLFDKYAVARTEHDALVKSTTKIFSNFVAFFENPNFNVIYGWPSKVDEMSCICAGANFLLKNIADESFMYERQQTPHYMFQSSNPNDLYPYLLVNWFWNNKISNFERALLFYQPKDQSMKFSWKNIENRRS